MHVLHDHIISNLCPLSLTLSSLTLTLSSWSFGSAGLLLGRSRRGLDVIRQPGESLEETLAGGCAAGDDVPDLVFEFGEL